MPGRGLPQPSTGEHAGACLTHLPGSGLPERCPQLSAREGWQWGPYTPVPQGWGWAGASQVGGGDQGGRSPGDTAHGEGECSLSLSWGHGGSEKKALPTTSVRCSPGRKENVCSLTACPLHPPCYPPKFQVTMFRSLATEQSPWSATQGHHRPHARSPALPTVSNKGVSRAGSVGENVGTGCTGDTFGHPCRRPVRGRGIIVEGPGAFCGDTALHSCVDIRRCIGLPNPGLHLCFQRLRGTWAGSPRRTAPLAHHGLRCPSEPSAFLAHCRWDKPEVGQAAGRGSLGLCSRVCPESTRLVTTAPSAARGELHLHCSAPSVCPNLKGNSRVEIYVQNKAAGRGCPH